MTQDEEQLHLLSVFHYVLAGLCALFSLLPLIYFAMGLAMMSGMGAGRSGGEFGALLGGCVVAGKGGLFLVYAVGYALALFLAARYLAERRRHTFCVVVAALSCCFTPLGTVLGVFTLIVLFRPSVKTLFGLDAPPGAA
ncbi:MAG: hypothetical protein QG573_921 [Acidobacteriota bacterium]|nr:hypothetical protein [Acidobacteriota bacterium]